MKKQKPIILLFPQFSPKIGYGHLKRSLILYELLQKNYCVKIIYYKNKTDLNADYIYFQSKNNLIAYIRQEKPLFIVLDFRYYQEKLVKKLSSFSKLIILDSKQVFETQKIKLYLNPITPLKYRYLTPNNFIYEGLEYLPLNKYLLKYVRKKPESKNNLFICFGNNDPNKLSLKVLKALKKIRPDYIICLNIGKYCNAYYRVTLKKYLIKHFSNYRIIENKESIIPEIFFCKYLITSFSITALEGLLLSKHTGLYNNSCYHTKLSNNYNGFGYLGTYPFSLNFHLEKKLRKFFSDHNTYASINLNNNNQNILKIIKKMEKIENFPDKLELCPVCKSPKTALILNQIDKQIYHCKKCKSKFLKTNKKQNLKNTYNKSYFNEEYKQQYGKTYLEDKDNILKLADQRLSIISKILNGKTKNKKILDIGCAYGFFLEKALAFNFKPSGLEIEKSAVRYIKKRLKIEIIHKDFLKYGFNETFDVITLWYVLEHFPEPDRVISKILTILKPQGLLCLSMPNANGPFYRFNKKEWLNRHPDDHFIDYSIKGIQQFLKNKGYVLIKKRMGGFHPERYARFPRFLLPFFRLLNKRDTMELYFQSIK